MSYGNVSCPDGNCTSYGFCQALTVGALDTNIPNNPTTSMTPVGTLSALLDPSNQPGMVSSEALSPSAGNKRSLRIKYRKRGVVSEVGDTVSCDYGTPSDYLEDTICPTLSSEINILVTQEQLQAYCSDALQTIQYGAAPTPLYLEMVDLVRSKMNALRVHMNQAIVAKILANVGVNPTYGNNTPQNIAFLNGTTGGTVITGWQTILADLKRAEKNGRPLVIGDGKMQNAVWNSSYACCNSDGFDLNALSNTQPVLPFMDFDVPQLYGNNDYFLVLAPGTVTLIRYNDHKFYSKWDGGRLGDVLTGYIPDPETGLEFDMLIEAKRCRTEDSPLFEFNIKLYLNYDVVFIPSNSYDSTDRLYQDNGIYNYIATTI